MSVRSMVGGGVQERWKVPFTDSPISPNTLPGGPLKEGRVSWITTGKQN